MGFSDSGILKGFLSGFSTPELLLSTGPSGGGALQLFPSPGMAADRLFRSGSPPEPLPDTILGDGESYTAHPPDGSGRPGLARDTQIREQEWPRSTRKRAKDAHRDGAQIFLSRKVQKPIGVSNFSAE